VDLHYEDPGVDKLYHRIWGEDIHYGIYESENEPIAAATQRAKAEMAKPLALTPEWLVLEVGCGYGATARFLAERYGCKVVATNIASGQLRRAQEATKATAVAELVRFEVADYHDLPYGDGQFDCWWCQEALVHSPDKLLVLQEAHRVLKPGGYAVVSDQIFRPNRLTQEELQAVRERYHTERISGPNDYADMIREAGFELIEHRNWQEHAKTHRRRIRDRLAELTPELSEEVSPETLRRNYQSWDAWAKLAEAGKLGFDYFLARKPG